MFCSAVWVRASIEFLLYEHVSAPLRSLLKNGKIHINPECANCVLWSRHVTSNFPLNVCLILLLPKLVCSVSKIKRETVTKMLECNQLYPPPRTHTLARAHTHTHTHTHTSVFIWIHPFEFSKEWKALQSEHLHFSVIRISSYVSWPFKQS